MNIPHSVPLNSSKYFQVRDSRQAYMLHLFMIEMVRQKSMLLRWTLSVFVLSSPFSLSLFTFSLCFLLHPFLRSYIFSNGRDNLFPICDRNVPSQINSMMNGRRQIRTENDTEAENFPLTLVINFLCHIIFFAH